MIFFRIISHIIYFFLLSLSLSKCEVGFTTSTNFSILLYYITLYLFIVVYHTLWKWNKGFGSLSIFFFLWWDIQCPRTQLMSCCLLFFFFFLSSLSPMLSEICLPKVFGNFTKAPETIFQQHGGACHLAASLIKIEQF